METSKKVEKSILFYQLFIIIGQPIFWGPVLISFITNTGKMDLSQLYIMEAIVVLGLVFVEIFSSSCADLCSRKNVLLVGSFLHLVAVVLFALASSPFLIWVSNILIMIGCALQSGVSEAFLKDSLIAIGRTHEYSKVIGYGISWRFALLGIGSLLAGYLYVIDPRLPMFLSIPGCVFSFICIMLINEDMSWKRVCKPKSRPTENIGFIGTMQKTFFSFRKNVKENFCLVKESYFFITNHRVLKWVIGYSAILLISSKLWFFAYNPYFEIVELDAHLWGWLFFGMNIIAWITSRYAHITEEKAGELAIIIILPLCIILPLLIMGTFVLKASASMILFQNIVRGFQGTFLSAFVNKHLNSYNRSTSNSIQSAVISIYCAISLLIFGIAIRYLSLSECLQILGLAVLAFSVLSWRDYLRIISVKN